MNVKEDFENNIYNDLDFNLKISNTNDECNRR